MPAFKIRTLDATEAKARIGELTDILLDCVAGGASVSFMADMTRDEALAFWQKVISGVAGGARVLVVAEQAGRLIGTVQVVASGIPNQPHRSDLAKMLVHRSGRGHGVGAALLSEAEALSLKSGWWLMVLDTVVDSTADRLYRRGGWKPVGIVPNYALWPDGALCGTRYFYKDLRPALGITITQEPANQSEIIALFEASYQYSGALYPAESNHMLDVSDLTKPDVRFFVARQNGTVIGCGALVIKSDNTGELKSFITHESARGNGAGSALIQACEQAARTEGVTLLRLETGIYSAPALALYRKYGFTPCPAFAPYGPDPYSVFMEKRLA
jgi:GNAT superfamily N-acetyltransferase